MLKRTSVACALLLLSSTTALAASEGSLRGSRESMIRQNRVAKQQEYTFLRTPAQVERFVEQGHLVPVQGNQNYELANVSFPYARPELRTFVERLAAQYREGCGEKLVVTSLTRPLSSQPGNAHKLSVHPAGMAVDLRISSSGSCRSWIEGVLLSLESQELLDITRERHPPHYHIAVYPEAYLAHVERMIADSVLVAQEQLAALYAATAASAWRAAENARSDSLRMASIAPASAGDPRARLADWVFWTGMVLLGMVLAITRAWRPSAPRASDE